MGSRTRQQQGLSVTNGRRSPTPGNSGTPALTYTSGANLIDQLSQARGGPSFMSKARTGGSPSMLQTGPQPQNYMGALNATAQPGVTYNTQMQQQLANNSAQSQAPIGSSFVDALDRQQGVTYNVDMQKRMANASAISQGLPPPFPGY